jgi:hypothetical protein
MSLQAKNLDLQTQKKSQAFESGMMELSAIRHRLQEGIAANAKHDAQESQRVSSTEQLRVCFLGFLGAEYWDAVLP